MIRPDQTRREAKSRLNEFSANEACQIRIALLNRKEMLTELLASLGTPELAIYAWETRESLKQTDALIAELCNL